MAGYHEHSYDFRFTPRLEVGHTDSSGRWIPPKTVVPESTDTVIGRTSAQIAAEREAARAAAQAARERDRPVMTGVSPREQARRDAVRAAQARLIQDIRDGRGGQGDADMHLNNAATTALAATAAASSLPAAIVSMAPLAAQVQHEYNEGGWDQLLSSPATPQTVIMALPYVRAYGLPVLKGVGREVYGNIRHMVGESPQVVMPVGRNGVGRMQAAAGAASKAVQEAIRDIDFTGERLPGDSRVYTAVPKLSAQGRAVLDADATMLDRFYTAVRRQLRTSDRGVPVDQMLSGRDPQAKAMRLAYPQGLKRTEVFLENTLEGADASSLGWANPDPVWPEIHLNTALLSRGRSRLPTFGHEFFHTLAPRESFRMSNRGWNADVTVLNPRVQAAADKHARLATEAYKRAHGLDPHSYSEESLQAYVDAYGAALQRESYISQIHENSARAIGLMNHTGARNFSELLELLPEEPDLIGRPTIQHPDSLGYPVFTDYFYLQDHVPRADQVSVPLDQLASKGGDSGRSTRAAESGGVPEGGEASTEPVPETSQAPEDGPRIVINPKVFKDKRDALCVAFNEAFRIVMEDNGFEPVSEPTERQRKFFSDTAYANDEVQLRRTILARIATLDTSVKDPTQEQIEETVEMLEMVMEVGAPQSEWEQSCVQKLHDRLVHQVEEQPQEQPQEPPQEPPQEQPQDVDLNMAPVV